jgi:glutamine synthetase
MIVVDTLSWLAERTDLRSLRAAVCDLNGVMRGKRIPIEQAQKVLDGGLRMPLSVVGVDIWGEDIANSPLVFTTGDADGLCEPIGRGILPMDWTPEPTALIPLWLREENGNPFGGDPRRALAALVERYAAVDLHPVIAMELEFYLYDPKGERPAAPISPVTGKRLDADAVLSIDEMDEFGAFFRDVYAACAQQGVPADSAIAENGIGQFEINLLHVNDPLRAADDAILFKRIVKGVARKHSFAASFMAKPYGGRSGSGLHVHFSLLDGNGVNVFDNDSDEGSATMRYAVGGLLEAMADTTLLFAPHFNSYRRLRPGTHAPSAAAWGYENRTVAIRIPGGSPKARRIEHRVAGADANPYLVLAGILGGALIGIERQIRPIDPVRGDAYALKLKSLPPDWASAINAFADSEIVDVTLPPMLRDMLVACKRQEMATFAAQVTDFEYEAYLDMV